MSDVLVLGSTTADALAAVDAEDLGTAAVWPCQADGSSAWAVTFHDGLAAAGASSSPEPGDVARVASWLRVQAVGRDTVVVTEPRIARFATVWSEGAALAGIGAVRLAAAGDQAAADPMAAPETGPAATWRPGSIRARTGWADRSRLWLVDRAEGTARWVVRGLQR